MLCLKDGINHVMEVTKFALKCLASKELVFHISTKQIDASVCL